MVTRTSALWRKPWTSLALAALAAASIPSAALAQDAPPELPASPPEAAAAAPEAPQEAAPEAAIAPVAPAASAAPALAAPRVHHAPISSVNQREPVPIAVTFDHAERIREARVVYRSATSVTGSVVLQRSSGASYVAVIPPEAAIAPWLGYAIEIETIEGAVIASFASRAHPHVVEVLENQSDLRERALLTRLSGRRSVVSVSGEYVRFGKTEPSGSLVCASGQDRCKENEILQPKDAAVDDQYYRIEAGYTYRPLGTVAEFSLRGGVIRGTSLVATSIFDEDKYKVGANYGAPTVRFRLADNWHLEAEFLTSITEVGFSVGFGSALLIGDPYGTKLTLGFETIGPGNDTAYFGSRFYSRVDIAASSVITVAPIIEVTDMPHAEEFGVRLLGEAGFALGGGFGLAVRGGYQARKSTSGGASAGGSLSLAF